MKTNDKNIHNGHRQRLFKKFFEYNGKNLEDYEVIEVLLCLKIPRGNVNPTAHKLINKYKTISNILDASIEDLMTVEGIGKQTALFLHTLPKFLKFYLENKEIEKKKLSNFSETEKYIRSQFLNINTECILAIALSSSNKIIASEVLFTGNEVNVDLDMVKLHKFIFKNQASGVIIAHNHLDDNCTPSNADIYTTEKIYTSLKIINVQLLDHIIISKTNSYSFFESGLLDEIKQHYQFNEINKNFQNRPTFIKK